MSDGKERPDPRVKKMEVWLEAEKKVLLAQFLDSTMAKDADPTGKDSYTEDFWRVKTYTKDHDKLKPFPERDFCEPYMVAQHYCGGTWNDYNQPFVVQVGKCNLNCFWCFVPNRLRNASEGAYFTAEEVVDMFLANRQRGVLRISGGEPFLAPEFLFELGNAFLKRLVQHPERMQYCYLWIDTNLLGVGYKLVLEHFNNLRIPYGICGCFKGFDAHTFEQNMAVSEVGQASMLHSPDFAPVIFSKQFESARRILEAIGGRGELFFYVPEIVKCPIPSIDVSDPVKSGEIKADMNTRISQFVKRMRREVSLFAPLRTTILAIKEYESNKEQMITDRIPSGWTKQIWNEILEKTYALDWRWLPQYQIPLRKRFCNL